MQDTSISEAPIIEEPDENSPDVKKIRQADLVISPILIALSAWFGYDSYVLSKKAIMAGQATISTSPGLFPLVTCAAIAACSVYVLIHALRTRPSLDFLSWQVIRRHYSAFDPWVSIIVFGLFAIYVFVFLNRMPFELATIIYILAMMIIFKATRLWIAVPVAVFYTLGVAFSFTQWAATLLPKSIF
jgi:hypothetical protein